MNAEQLFEIWVPSGVIWSDWAKPVLFATMPRIEVSPDLADLSMETPWLEFVPDAHALVIDLPGVSSVCCGYHLASQGFRPVPLFNGAYGPRAVVAVDKIAAALQALSEPLARLSVAAEALPAFLLDSDRMGTGAEPNSGDFDNRWLVFPQDFPSARFLKSKKIDGIVLVTKNAQPAEDLSHILLRWQEAGLPISIANSNISDRPRLIQVRRPTGFRRFYHRLLVTLGLRRSSAGGFGSVVPQPSSSGGFA